MQDSVEYADLDDALRRCGATWNGAQAHGFLCSRLSLGGADAGGEWLALVLDGDGDGNGEGDGNSARAEARDECRAMLENLFAATFRALAERQSQFAPLLPDDTSPAAERTGGLAHWCEGYLHGLVSGRHDERLRARLADEPVAGIIRDLLEITRATIDTHARDEANEEAYTELVEYIRVAVQLVYEELAEFRAPAGRDAGGGVSRPLH